MKIFLHTMIVSLLLLVAVPAWSDSVVQIYKCEQDDDTTSEQFGAMAEEWLKAAKTVKGGENLELHVHFPIAAPVGEIDFLMVLIAPSFAEWGEFTDNYPGSAADKIDEKYSDAVTCPESTLWNSVIVK